MIPLGVLAASRHIPAGGGGTLTLTYGGWTEDAANAATYSLTDLPIGAADPTREVVVVIAHRSSDTAPTVSSCTINGVPAVIDIETVVSDNSARSLLAVARAAVPSGTTAAVSVTFSASGLRTFAAAYTLTGGTATVAGTDSGRIPGASQTLTLTPAPSTGPALIAACVVAGNLAPTLGTDSADVSQNSSESNFWLGVGHSTTSPASVAVSSPLHTPPAVAVAYSA